MKDTRCRIEKKKFTKYLTNRNKSRNFVKQIRKRPKSFFEN